MKKLVYLVLLFTGIVNAQIVNIPDANFKAKLLTSSSSALVATNLAGTYFKIDSNSDGQIQVSEALQVGGIFVSSSSITSLTGIESFANLRILNCSQNQIPTITLNGFNLLEQLICNTNLLTSLNLSNLPALNRLICSGNQLTSLNVNSLTTLQYFECRGNQLTSLNVSALVNLITFWCGSNQITSLNVSNSTNLQIFYCEVNQLTSIDITALNNLLQFGCYNNQITSLNVNGNTTLQQLNCGYNQLTSINTSNLNNLQRFLCNNNQITSLYTDNLTNVQFLNCIGNQLQTLDVTKMTSLGQFFCGSNALTTLFVKNGMVEDLLDFSNNPGIQYVCADADQLAAVQTLLTSYGYTNCTTNDYCSFTPGGNYNTITGAMIFDANNNGCDTNDARQPNIKISIASGSNQGTTFTNFNGNYNFYTQAGSFTLTPNVENPTFFSFSPPTATIPFANNANNTATQNFCISGVGIHNDLEVVIAPITTARPGFDARYIIVFKNKGNQTLSGNVALNYNDAVLDFVTANVGPSSQSTGIINWNYANLLPFQSRSFSVTFNVNSPTETPAVNIGDVLPFQVSITPTSGDENPADNTFSYNQTVVGAFDPNDITCLEGATVPPSMIGQYLHYVINFENTGNFEAENIVVRTDINPANYDINTLQMLNTSHNAYIRQTGNTIEFIFQEIQLETGGHGNILLKIKSKNNLVDGDTIANRGDIFFDYNAPIDTGAANTTFQSLSNGNFEIDDAVSVHPNPVTTIVNINGKHVIKSVQLFDVQGRLLQTVIENQANTSLDISERQSGIYFLKITTEVGTKIEKIIKK